MASFEQIDNCDDLQFLADILAEDRRFQDATIVLKHADKTFGLDDVGLNNLGYFYSVVGNRSEAIRTYRKSFDFNPNNLSSLRNLAMESGDLCLSKINFERRRDGESWVWYLASAWNQQDFIELNKGFQELREEFLDDPDICVTVSNLCSLIVDNKQASKEIKQLATVILRALMISETRKSESYEPRAT